MPIYSRKEFGKQCGVTAAYISVNIKRKKIVLDKAGNVDTGNEVNQFFMETRVAVNEGTAPKLKPGNKKKTKAKPKSSKESPVIEMHEEDNIQSAGTNKYNLDVIAKELEIEKKTEEIELLKIRKEKAKGEVIPTDLVLSVFAQHFKSITNAFYQAADNLAVEMAKEAGKGREMVIKIRGKLVKEVNSAVETSQKESKKELKHIVSEYSMTRGVGEKK